MQVNPEDGPPEIYVTWSDPRMTDFKNAAFCTPIGVYPFFSLFDGRYHYFLVKRNFF